VQPNKAEKSFSRKEPPDAIGGSFFLLVRSEHVYERSHRKKTVRDTSFLHQPCGLCFWAILCHISLRFAPLGPSGIGDLQRARHYMTGKEVLKLIALQRSERVQKILDNPNRYQVCEGCSSLLSQNPWYDGVCLFCGAYRFCREPEAVLEIARLLKDRTIAVGCPYLPRDITPRGLTHA
jgi:hypothetical protein